MSFEPVILDNEDGPLAVKHPNRAVYIFLFLIVVALFMGCYQEVRDSGSQPAPAIGHRPAESPTDDTLAPKPQQAYFP